MTTRQAGLISIVALFALLLIALIVLGLRQPWPRTSPVPLEIDYICWTDEKSGELLCAPWDELMATPTP